MPFTVVLASYSTVSFGLTPEDFKESLPVFKKYKNIKKKLEGGGIGTLYKGKECLNFTSSVLKRAVYLCYIC